MWLVHNTMQVPHALMDTPGFRQAMMLWYFVDREFVPREIFDDCSGTLFSVWNTVQYMEASNPKDNVYALLGMVQRPWRKGSNLTLVPDYTKSDLEVFRDATRIMIEEKGSLEVFLVRHETVNDCFEGAPSWVTNFAVKTCVTPDVLGKSEPCQHEPHMPGASFKQFQQV